MTPYVVAFAVGMFGLGVLLAALARHSEAVVWRDWELALTPRGMKLLDRVREAFGADIMLADYAYERAWEERARGSVDEAYRLLDLGYRVMARMAPNLLRLVTSLAGFSRMVTAVAPLPPLRPRDFRVKKLVRLAYLNAFIHHFLVSTAERFRLRAYCLKHGIRVATSYLLDSTRRRDWREIPLVRQDLDVLTDETLESLRAVLVTVVAERRCDVAVRSESTGSR